MLKKLPIICVLFTLSSVYANAAQSLIETYEQASQNDPTLQMAQLAVLSAQQDVTNGLSNVLPNVSASASYGIGNDASMDGEESLALDSDFQAINGSLDITQNVFALAAFTAYEAVKVNASIEDIEAAYAEQDLMVRVAEAYLNALRAKDALDVAKAQLAAVERQFEQTEQRYDVGLVPITDVLDATATLDETKVSLIRANSSYNIALQNISITTGQSPDGILDISDSIPITQLDESLQEQWIELAITQHPDIIVAERGLQVGQLTARALAQQYRLPTVGASISFDYDDIYNYDYYNNDDEDNWSVAVGVQVSMDLFTGGANNSAIAKQGIQNNIVEQQIELLKRGKAVTVANLFNSVQADAQNVAAQQQALKSRQSALQATEVGYDVGTRNIVEVLDSQLAVFSAQNNLNNARYDYLIDLLNLKKETGLLAFQDLASIDQYLIAE
ncbi:TolC family outer membrane protein [Reinekea thalattae]|uniref:TolC family outer membrane protein n=1 Tax=Reinekea thalattae TaxID=2593301 RepID=A0A5C8Z3B4_9GAMM|nr:TolC family outer membrane protein [Reinekea thalattae]TXR51420.1 TolC family outer membrane protein [Reinekea thalattae]